MKRKLLFFLTLVLVLSLFVGCTEAKESRTIKFYYPDGLPALTAAKLAKENPNIDENIIMDYELQKTPDLLASKIIKGEPDIAIVPSNLAVQAFNKDIPYKLVGTATWGSIYLIGTEDINNFEDLKGREIYCFARGLTPDIVFRYVLSNNGIDPDNDVDITYLNSGAEVAPAFISGKTDLAIIAEPLATNVLMKKEDTKFIFSLNEEWSKLAGDSQGYPQSSLIIKSDLLENEREFVEKFLKEYEESSNWASNNPENLGDYAEDLEIAVPIDAIIKGQDRMNMKFVDTKDCKDEYELYFKAMLDFAPDSIGGKLPDEEFYFER